MVAKILSQSAYFPQKVLNDSLSVIREFTMRNLITDAFFPYCYLLEESFLSFIRISSILWFFNFLLIVLDRYLLFFFFFFFNLLYIWLNGLLGLTLLIQPESILSYGDHEFLRNVLLHFQVQCPLSIILSSKTLTVFRKCHYKHIDYQLCGDVANASSFFFFKYLSYILSSLHITGLFVIL